MKKMLLIFFAVAGLFFHPLCASAAQGRSIYFLLEGGKAWGSSLDGPLASPKIFLPLAGGVWMQAGYIHYFDPVIYERTPNKRSAFTLGLQFKTRERGRRIQWFAHCDGGSFRSNYALWDEPGVFLRDFGLGLGVGLEKPLSDRWGLRFNIRGWTFFTKDSFFGDAWAETSLGLIYRLKAGRVSASFSK